MGFWCCVVAPKTVLLFIPLAIYIWNRFLQPIWSNFWNTNREEEIENHVIENTNENLLLPEEDCCDKEIDANVNNNSNREKID